MSLFLTLWLTLRILVSLLLTLNVFHILHDVKNVEIRALYWKKRKVSLAVYKFAIEAPPVRRPNFFHNAIFSQRGQISAGSIKDF